MRCCQYPLHRWRLMKRGFNQARELAEPVARMLELPLVENVRRRRATPYQSVLGPRERRTNLHGAFVVKGKVPARHVLIVDDVITTGESCRQVADVLRRHGVSKVSALAVARAVR